MICQLNICILLCKSFFFLLLYVIEPFWAFLNWFFLSVGFFFVKERELFYRPHTQTIKNEWLNKSVTSIFKIILSLFFHEFVNQSNLCPIDCPIPGFMRKHLQLHHPQIKPIIWFLFFFFCFGWNRTYEYLI